MKVIALVSLSVSLFALISCGSVSDSSDDTTERPDGSRPTSSVNLSFLENIAMARVAPNDPIESINILNNPDFEKGLSGWQSCDQATISTSNDSASGSSALELKSKQCMYQSVKAAPGQSYTVNCQVKLLENKSWTGLGVNASNSNYEILEEAAPAVVTSEKYTRVDATVLAPINTEWLTVWLYTDHGAVIDNCRLTLESSAIPPIDIRTPDTNETEWPALSLLRNGSFSSLNKVGNAKSWAAGCGGSAWVDDGKMSIENGACVDQSLNSGRVRKINNNPTTFSCLVKSVSGYSDLSVFINGDLVSNKSVSADDINRRVSLPFTATNAKNAFVSLYSDGNLQVDDCILVVDGSEDIDDTEVTDNTPVVFESTDLEALVRKELQTAGLTIDTANPITRENMAKLISLSSINPPLADIDNFTGLEYAINLEELMVRSDVRDLTPLSGLNKLKTLRIWSEYVVDINAVTNLKNLEWLQLQLAPSFSDISPLVALTELTTLSLTGSSDLTPSAITDLSPLQGLNKLTTLYLNYTNVADVSPIASLPNLSTLYLWGAPVDSFQSLVDGTFWSNVPARSSGFYTSLLYIDLLVDLSAYSPNLIALHTLQDRSVFISFKGRTGPYQSTLPAIDVGCQATMAERSLGLC